MTSNKVSVCLAVVCSVLGAALAAPQGYLPPQKGYNYDQPLLPFPGTNTPTKLPYPNRPSQPTPGPTPGPTYGSPPSHDHEHHDEHHHHEPGMPFDFNYEVKEQEYGNDYSHNAVSDGDITRGEYRVQLPDGRLQIVKYTADWKNGFNAEVSYEGEAKYPEQTPNQPNTNYGSPPTGGYKY